MTPGRRSELMAEEDAKDGEPSIYKVDTVPPPAGDSDAYNAPTRVGPASIAEWADLVKRADDEGKKLAEEIENSPASARLKRPPASTPSPTSSPGSSKRPVEPPPVEVPKIYSDDGEENEDAATLLRSDGPFSDFPAKLAAAAASASAAPPAAPAPTVKTPPMPTPVAVSAPPATAAPAPSFAPPQAMAVAPPTPMFAPPSPSVPDAAQPTVGRPLWIVFAVCAAIFVCGLLLFVLR